MRLAVAVLLCAIAGGVYAATASACSCATARESDRFGAAPAAFVGTALERRDPSGGMGVSSADPVTYVFRVDEAYKGDLGATVEIVTARYGASCGLEVGIGQQIGLYLSRRGDGTWTSSLCQQTTPEKMRAAAAPYRDALAPKPVLRDLRSICRANKPKRAKRARKARRRS